MQTPVQSHTILRFQEQHFQSEQDLLAVEEPLQILVQYGEAASRNEKVFTLTMRTPGHDHELAIGLALSEGLIPSPQAISKLYHCQQVEAEARGNVLKMQLKPHILPHWPSVERNLSSNASCGICGKTNLDAIKTDCQPISVEEAYLRSEVLARLVDALGERQSLFRHTGGIHAAALYDADGHLLILREDIGRHNALDKLIGAIAAKPEILPGTSILLLSGRVGFELVQKAARAGLPSIVALGAPSSLAVALAQQQGQTLIGFLKPGRFNVYCFAERLVKC